MSEREIEGLEEFVPSPGERMVLSTADVRSLLARAWQEGRESIGQDFLNPLDEHGQRPKTPNPYLDPKVTRLAEIIEEKAQVIRPHWEQQINPKPQGMPLCDEEGIVVRGPGSGEGISCTGSAHFGSTLVLCTNERHPRGGWPNPCLHEGPTFICDNPIHQQESPQ